MKNLFKRHIGLLILLAILVALPISLNYQARLNMRIIVTGLAIDKTEDGYEVTAQIVKTTPGNQTPGASATLDFISDTDATLAGAVSKLSYKAGKVAAFSHTNFVIMGNGMLEEEITKSLDYFIRDRIIKNSALLLFAEKEAKEEIKKTKNIELSVGLGLQKVFIYKERDGDGIMATVLSFLNKNKNFSKTAVASMFSLKSNEEGSSGSSGGSGGSGGSGESSGASGGEASGSGGSSGESSGSGGSGGGSDTQFFEPHTPVLCFVDGKFSGKIEGEDEIAGFMMAYKNAKSIDFNVKLEESRLAGKELAISVKNKRSSLKLRYENGVPCADIKVTLYNAEVNEILSEDIVPSLSEEEFEQVKQAISKTISENIASCHKRAKELNADVFGAYEKAQKFSYQKTHEKYDDPVQFISDLKLNVMVEVKKLEY